MVNRRWMALALAGALAAVAVAPAAAQSVDIKPTEKVKRDKNVLLPDEIAERQGILNAYDAVKQLRPQFLKRSTNRNALGSNNEGGGFGANPSPDLSPPSREGGGLKPGSETPVYSSGRKSSSSTDAMGNPKDAENIGYAVLYINDMKQQSLEDLKTVRVSDVLEIRFLNAGQASVRFGQGHEAGAVLLKTIPPTKP